MNNVNVTNIHNVYNTTVINNTTVNRISYNGGNGGITARPRPEEEAAARERHTPPVAAQTQHEQAARAKPELRASVNHGTPTVAATPKPGAFKRPRRRTRQSRRGHLTPSGETSRRSATGRCTSCATKKWCRTSRPACAE